MLELIVASVILMMMLAMLFMAANGITSSWGKINREKDHFMAVIAVDRAIDSLFSNILPFRWHDSENNPLLAFRGESEQVSFVYRHRLNNIKDGALRNVIIFVENDKLKATYQERPLLELGKDPGPRAETVVLAEGIERIEIQYADWRLDHGIEWTDHWNIENERNETPLGVLIEVYWLNGYQESWLRRTAGNGFDEQLGDWQPKRL